MKVLAQALPVNIFSIVRMFLVVFAFVLLFTVLPVSVRAAELTQEQKESILQLIQSFGADQIVLDNVSEALGANVPLVPEELRASENPVAPKERGNLSKPPHALIKQQNPVAATCRMLGSMKRGLQGEDVLHVQEFLRKTGDFTEASSTGYFGPATERALQMWQARAGVVNSGDPETTGFGAVGPRTREAIIAHCREMQQKFNPDVSSSTSATDTNRPPVCILTAAKNVVTAGEKVVLMWDSKYATHTTGADGVAGPVRGSVEVAPTVTTIYAKKVFGPGGEAQCTKKIEVTGTVPATEPKVVIVPMRIDVGRVFSLLGGGVAAVFEGYISLFDFR